jgi:hypothetical protein
MIEESCDDADDHQEGSDEGSLHDGSEESTLQARARKGRTSRRRATAGPV